MKLPRLNIGWDEQPGLFPRYWDTAMTAIESAEEGSTNEIYIDQFYLTGTSTDSDALTEFANQFNTGSLGDVTLYFAPGKGRGPSGRYIIDREILFTSGNRLVLDFRESTLRWTTPVSRIHYKAPYITGSSGVTPTSFFIVRNGVCQYATAIDCLFYWDFPYINSRDMGTGYVENLRCIPQDNNNAGHQAYSTFKTKNTWYWSADRVHAKGPPRTIGNYVPGTSFLRQEQLCVVTFITRCELEFYDTAIVPGITALVGADGTFLAGGSYSRYKTVVQGGNSGVFVRNDSFSGGGQYTLADEVGTLVPGACTLLDPSGAVIPGIFQITAITRFGQAAEAISVSGATTIINGNYVIDAVSPSPSTKFLEWNFEDMHINLAKGAVRVDGLSALSFGNGTWCTSPSAGITFVDVNNGDSINIDNFQFTSNDLPNVTIFKGRNISSGRFSNNTLYLIKYAVDLDNTVKDFKVHGNSAYEVTTGNNPALPTFLNTGKRFNATNTRGIDFKSNGAMGRGFDTDANYVVPWTVVPFMDVGAVGIAPVAGNIHGYISVQNGVVTLNCRFTITSITGGANTTTPNTMSLSLPALLSAYGVNTFTVFPNFTARCVLANVEVPAFYDPPSNRLLIPNADPWRQNASQASALRVDNIALTPSIVVHLQASFPIEYD